MNVVILTGRLAVEPELQQTSRGTAWISFPLAVDRNTKEREADFPTVTAWRETAEFVSRYLHKGSRVVVRGEVRTRNYDGNDGKSHKVTEIQADRIEFADSRPQGQGE